MSVVSQVENTCRILDTSQKDLRQWGYNQQQVFTGGVAQLKMGDWPAGIYILEITREHQKKNTFKVILDK